MKYYSYHEYNPDPNASNIVTISEKEILDTFWDSWKEKMIKKFGKESFEANFSEKHCIEDWVIVNWAWESEA